MASQPHPLAPWNPLISLETQYIGCAVIRLLSEFLRTGTERGRESFSEGIDFED